VNSAFPGEKFPLFKMPDVASMQNVNTLLGQNTAAGLSCQCERDDGAVGPVVNVSNAVSLLVCRQ
jgi:hypothetical protein